LRVFHTPSHCPLSLLLLLSSCTQHTTCTTYTSSHGSWTETRIGNTLVFTITREPLLATGGIGSHLFGRTTMIAE
jgi:hypothetical protein